jgi:phosphate transport system substrate-binding protein
MKNFRYLLSGLFFILFLFSCEKEPIDSGFYIEGLTTENYPRVDGSTSTAPLQTLIACKLLNCRYEWQQQLHAYFTWEIRPNYDDVPYSFFEERIKTSQTHNSFINLIDEEADFILTHRTASDDETVYAAQAGVSLTETPVARDAFIFIVNDKNPVKSLTHKQIQDIYMGKITNWKEVGGNNMPIKPYVRNQNSGSQELMETVVMKGLQMPEWSEEAELASMILAFMRVRNEENAICFTVYYYKEQIVRDNEHVKTLSVNGIYPDRNTLSRRTYPYAVDVYAVIRSDKDRSSNAYKLYDLLQTKAGKSVIAQSGYIPD